MILSPENILLKNESIFKTNAFFISGNETTLISKIKKTIIEKLKLNNFEEIDFIDTKTINEGSLVVNSVSLFSNKKILLFKDPKEIDVESFKNFNNNIAVIIVDEKIKNSSTIKKEITKSQNIYSITCYKMDRGMKKKLLDFFLKESSVVLKQESYWFLLDYLSDDYLLMESELKKLTNYNKTITLEEIKLLFSKGEETEIDKLFFSLPKSQEKTILISRVLLNSSSDAYFLLQRFKFYIYLMANAVNIKDVENSFPKYLFKEKDNFINMYKKTNAKKIARILKLIKKTEIMIRKHDIMYLILCQRFLLNARKCFL